jgi:hypothetical protein
VCHTFFEIFASQAGQHFLLGAQMPPLESQHASYTCRLITRNDRGLTVDAMSIAYLHALGKRFSRIDFASPILRFRCIDHSAVNSSSTRWLAHETQHPRHAVIGNQPTLCKGAEWRPIRSQRTNTKQSQSQTYHRPLIAATTGLPIAGKYEYFFSKFPRVRSLPLLVGCTPCARRASSSPLSATALKRDMSAPAQNPRPAPVKTIIRTFSSFSASLIAARTSRSMTAVQAFNLSGRLSVIVATRSATWYSVS